MHFSKVGVKIFTLPIIGYRKINERPQVRPLFRPASPLGMIAARAPRTILAIDPPVEKQHAEWLSIGGTISKP